MGMELQLGLSLSTHKLNVLDDDDDGGDCCLLHINNSNNDINKKKKRNFENAFAAGNYKFKEQSTKTTTFPLLLWSGLPNDDDDDDDHTNNNNGEVVEEEDFDGHLVGWPPIKSWRKKVLHGLHHHQQGGRILKKRVVPAAVDYLDHHCGSKNNMYVKVKMEGVAIARKVDLGLFHSYQTLTNCLINLFAECQEIEKDSAKYRLAYLDKDGELLLAGDVPWQTFIESAQRLELQRNGS